jgi:hypothetical protein
MDFDVAVLHQAGSGLYLKHVSLFQISPFSSRALPGTQQINSADAKNHAADLNVGLAEKK